MLVESSLKTLCEEFFDIGVALLKMMIRQIGDTSTKPD